MSERITIDNNNNIHCITSHKEDYKSAKMNENGNTLCPVVDSPSSSDESHPLLLPSAVTDGSSFSQRLSCQLLKHVCLPSKAANVLVCLSVVVGAMLAIFTCLFVLVAVCVVGGQYIDVTLAIILSYVAMMITVFLYPLSGFVADVILGRYRVMLISMCCIILSFPFILGSITLVLQDLKNFPFNWPKSSIILLIVFASCFCLTFGVGVVAYHANFIQFGLDQLMEAPTESLSLLIHWMIWADNFGFAIIIPLAAATLCRNSTTIAIITCSVPLLCLILLSIFLVFICRKRHWFYAEPEQHNPYKMVISVLNFAWKHNYPLQRSAFTYCDDERPSRLDFAKERFGGPFSTEQVEDVKIFLQIFLILLTIGSVSLLEVSSSSFGFPLISVHIAFKGIDYCDAYWIFVGSGTLRYITSAVFIPIYVCILFKRKRIPSILTRLGIGFVLYLIGTLSILLIDITGHAKNALIGNTSTHCMMEIGFNKNTSGLLIPRLKMHWATLILPNIFLGIGPLLVFISTFEFISAQSPHTMKGLIVGLCFTINRLFQLLGSIALFPFSYKKIWQSQHIEEHPPVTNCGFGYLSAVLLFALIGFILFLVAAKRYKFRERDDRPYDQRFVISVYDKYLK